MSRPHRVDASRGARTGPTMRDYDAGRAAGHATRAGGGGGGGGSSSGGGCCLLTLLLIPLALPLLPALWLLARQPVGEPLGRRRDDPRHRAGDWHPKRDDPPEHEGGWPAGRRPPLRTNLPEGS